MDIGGNSYIGIYCATNENITLTPFDLNKKVHSKITSALQTELVPCSVAGSRLIGSLLVMNSNGVILNNFAETGEIRKLKEHINVSVLEDKLNAVGNNILVNDHGALVHTDYSKKILSAIEDTLGVEVMKGTIAGLKTVGSAAVITNSGGLCHPKVKKDELELLNSFFKIEVTSGTANYGTPLIGACLIANSKGAVTGTKTTGIELGRIEDGFNLI